ncbi:MAG: hypothetical protein NT010_00470 [Proteobacteria bacterium]|nr:hypothetical protein [Pseudomonadota bacterium]
MKLIFTVFFALCMLTSPCYAGMIHYYSFTTDASDQVGGANGTLTNGASVAYGVLHLDGSNDYVQYSQRLVPTSGSYTVALFAAESLPKTDYAEMISQGYSGGPGFYIGHDPWGGVRVGDNSWPTGVAFPSDGLMHHYAFTVDAVAGKSKLFIDGKWAATYDGAITSTTGGDYTRLGSQFSYYGEFFGGTIDEVRIYDNALSASEVKSLYNPVPIPSALLLFAPGLASLAVIRRRFRK